MLTGMVNRMPMIGSMLSLVIVIAGMIKNMLSGSHMNMNVIVTMLAGMRSR
jgi:hypothetical protein